MRLMIAALLAGTLLALVPSLAGADSGSNSDRRRASSDLRIAGTASPDPSVVGQEVTFTVNVTNDGPDPATFVTIVASNIPDSLAVGDMSDGCQLIEDDINCDVDDIPFGQTQTITFVLTPSVPGSFSIPISTGASEDTNLPNNTGSIGFTVASCRPTRRPRA